MEHKTTEELEKIDLFPLLRSLGKQIRRLWWLVILLMVLLGGLRYWQALRSYAPLYESEAIFSATVKNQDTMDVLQHNYYYDNDAAKMAADTFSYVIGSDVMRERLTLALGAGGLNGSISSSAVPGTNFLVLTVRSTDPQAAYNIVRAVMELYPQVSTSVLGNIQMRITQEPTLPTAPCNQFSWHRQAAVGAAVGLVLGGAVIVLLALVNQTLVTSEDVKKLLNLSCLAEVPEVRRKHRTRTRAPALLLTSQEPDSNFTESFRLLRLKLLRQLRKEDQVLLFTSSIAAEGKTSMAVNTAMALALEGKTVLLVDGDLRAQSVKPLFGIHEDSTGLLEFLDHSSDSLPLMRMEESSLFLLAGDKTSENPTTLLRYDRLHSIFQALRSKFDYIIIDTPPAAMMADAAALSRHCDQVIYVIRQDYVTRSQLLDGIQSITGSGARVCGFVLNRVTEGAAPLRSGYGYGGYYGYGSKYGKYGKYGKYSSKSGSSTKSDS